MKYICYKRFKGKAISGKDVNIPAMTECDTKDNIIYRISDAYPLCVDTSQNGIEHFCQNEDGKGEYRGKLILALNKHLAQPDWHNELSFIGNKQPKDMSEEELSKLNKIMDKRIEEYNAKWQKIWDEQSLHKYKRKEHADMWLWNRDYYNAPIEDLEYICILTGLDLKRVK